MAEIYRSVHLSFWTDNKIVDDFTPEDKYFYLYLFTNPQTNLCGCYEVSISTMANQLGYNKDSVERLLDRFENFHHVLKYSKATKEVLVLNWYKYNWTKSESLLKGVCRQSENIKNPEFKTYILSKINEKSSSWGRSIDGGGTTVTDTNIYISNNNNSFSNKNTNKENYLYIYKTHPKGQFLIDNTELNQALVDWMDYKDNSKPKDKNYYKTERAMRSFITTIVNAAERYGVEPVIAEIDKAISGNWLGIHFEDLQNRELNPTVATDENFRLTVKAYPVEVTNLRDSKKAWGNAIRQLGDNKDSLRRIYAAIDLYKTHCKEQNRYAKNFDKWIETELDYWLEKVGA